MITGQAPRDTPQRQNSEGVTTPRGPFTGPHRSPSFTLPPIGSSLEPFQFTMSHLLLFPPAFTEAGDRCQGLREGYNQTASMSSILLCSPRT